MAICAPRMLKLILYCGIVVVSLPAKPNQGSPALARQQFERLWDMLGESPEAEGLPPPHVCVYGFNNATQEVALFLLGRTLTLEVHDVEATSGAPRGALALLRQLQMDFGHLVQREAWMEQPYSPPPLAPVCNLVIFSEAAPRFSLHRVLPRLGQEVVMALVSHTCILDQEQFATPHCNFVNVIWEKTALHKSGRCAGPVCMSRLPSQSLHDPNVLPLACEKFDSDEGWNASISEFWQDWFLYRNLLAESEGVSGRRVYVDVGAALPFEYSNTAFLDKCLGWQGVCIEPNPFLTAFLKAYRSCGVYQNCVDEEHRRAKSFSYPDGEYAFAADCLPLGEILTRAGLRGQRIEVLSIDVEHGEMRVLRGLPLDEFDVRIIVVEVTQGARWLEVDSLILPHGYAKLAIIGRDVVYVKLAELLTGGFASWPFLQGETAVLPSDWAEFHQRVVDEELEQEAEREKSAFERGLRRR